jgi:hypothetical protein
MNKKKLKGGKKKMGIAKRKDPKALQKRKSRKKLGLMVALVHFDPKILSNGLAKLRWACGRIAPRLGWQ